jgi:hypothetical protein
MLLLKLRSSMPRLCPRRWVDLLHQQHGQHSSLSMHYLEPLIVLVCNLD